MVIVVRDSDRDGASHVGGDRGGICAAWHDNITKTIYRIHCNRVSIPFSLPSSAMFTFFCYAEFCMLISAYEQKYATLVIRQRRRIMHTKLLSIHTKLL